MTDLPKKDLDLADGDFTRLPSRQDLEETLQRVMAGSTGHAVVFRLMASKGGVELSTQRSFMGKQLYTAQQISEIGDRYDILTERVNAMVNHGFKINRLEIASKDGLTGARIEFLTPRGRKYEHDYFHSGNPTALIPDDFLHDLKMFPSRHG